MSAADSRTIAERLRQQQNACMVSITIRGKVKEHNANVYQYQVLYFRAQRAARASGGSGRAGGPSNASPEAPRRR